MAHPNEDRMRQGFDAYAKADMATLSEMFDESVAWHQPPGSYALSGDYAGRDNVFGMFGTAIQLTDGTFSVDVHDVLANDEHGVALVRLTGKRGDRELDANSTFVYHLEDGRIVEAWHLTTDPHAFAEFWS